jgi:hypothetical protein
MSRRNRIGRFAAALAAAAAFVSAGCSSGGAGRPPYPTDPDPCASYCLKWVPPVYRPTPKFCAAPGKVVTRNVPVEKVVFQEVCRPGRCETKCVPDQCRRYGAVEVQPARTEWVKVKCKDPCTCCEEDCWKAVRVPPKFAWCEKCEVEKGFEYCSWTPPEYDVVARTVRSCEKVPTYIPGGATAVMVPELYTPGHWVWEKRYDCRECKTCPPPPNCAPMGAPCDVDPCGPDTYAPGIPVRGDFRRPPAE